MLFQDATNEEAAPATTPPSMQTDEDATTSANTSSPVDEETRSPLWLVTTEPLVNQFVVSLQRLRVELMQHPDVQHEVRFSRARITEVRTAFATMIRHGEAELHRLSQLICETFFTSFQMESVVIGEVESTHERFTLSQAISVAELYSTTDIDLGTRQLSKLQFFDGRGWSGTRLVANVVDYQPTTSNHYGIHRISTRIKAEEEIWNKVVDELFELDRLVVRDKKLRHLSQYVKDIFGIKIVVGEDADVHRVFNALAQQTWTDAALHLVQLHPSRATRQLELVEVKDYLTDGQTKRSGWAALKAIVRWNGKTFELQIHPLGNFLHERERLTNESHLSFKAKREQVREQVAAQIPLFRFYQELLRWLFLAPHTPPPQHPGVTVLLDD